MWTMAEGNCIRILLLTFLAKNNTDLIRSSRCPDRVFPPFPVNSLRKFTTSIFWNNRKVDIWTTHCQGTSPAQPSPARPGPVVTWVGLLAAGEIAALLLCVGFEIFYTLCGRISSLPPFFRLLLCTAQRKLPVGGWRPIMVQASGVGMG